MLPSASVSRRVSRRIFVQNLSFENEFDLHENEHVGGTHFDMDGSAQRLVLTQLKDKRQFGNGLLMHEYQY